MRSIRKTSQTSLLLNGAAILLVVSSLGVVLRSAFVSQHAEPCRERFATATRFSLESNGGPISTEQLQGEAANTDWGLMSGARVIGAGTGPAKYVLELDLASAPSVTQVSSADRVGMGFQWAPQSFGKPQAACLSYSVFVPVGFGFGKGGRLPGFLGEAADGESGTPAPFSTRYTWAADGELDVSLQRLGVSEGHLPKAKVGTFALVPGKWTELQQEVVLNTPGKSDGLLRVWQDGNLALEKTNLAFRAKPSVSLAGVLAEAAAGAEARGGSQKIWLSPFELSWN